MSLVADIAAGALITGLYLGGIGMGAAVLRLIGRLVGGTWSEVEPLSLLSRSAPFGIVILFAARIVLALMTPASGYTASTWLVARLILGGAAWIGVAWVSTRRPSQGASGAMLVLFGASLLPLSFDLITALEPHWVSSAETYAMAVRMLGSALATALLQHLADKDRRDLQGLLVATLLATLYLNLMSYLIPWYGDLPDKTVWIRLRHPWPWQAIIAAALGLGAVLPIPLLALQKRFGEVAARLAAILALTGFALQTAWLVAPTFGVTGMLAGALLGLVLFAAPLALWRRGRPAHAG